MNIELGTNPEMLPDAAKAEDVIPGFLMHLRLMLEIALGDEAEASHYNEAFKKRRHLTS